MEKIGWVDVVDYESADQNLKGIYDKVRSPGGQLDNLYQGFSLRPHTIKPADDLYIAAMHHEDNTLPKVFSELIGVYVAILSGCEYARKHHGHNFEHLLGDEQQAEVILANLEADQLELCGEAHEVSALRYVKKLCLKPEAVTQEDVAELSRHQWADGEILEIVQIVAMFSYFVRVINGVGISLVGDKVGLYS